MPALPRRGDDVINTDSFVIVVPRRTVVLSVVVVVPLSLKVLFPPLSVNSQTPSGVLVLSSILR